MSDPSKRRQLLLGTGLTLLVVGLVAYVVYAIADARPQATVRQAFFTTDGGETLFAAPADRRAPFEHKGADAVLAHVYQCDGEEFVAYLERFSPEAMSVFAEVEAYAETAQPGDPPPPMLDRARALARGGREVRRPGEEQWVPRDSPQGSAIVDNIECPDGSDGTPLPVAPD